MSDVKFSNLEINVSGFNLTIKHNKVQRFSADRTVSDAADKFTIAILDDDAYTLEKALLQGSSGISVTYFDENNNPKEHFAGNVTKMNSTFLNDRNLLTLEGYIGISIQDKYQLISRNWNKAVIFPWSEIWDDWVDTSDEDGEEKDLRSGGTKFWNWITFWDSEDGDRAKSDAMDSAMETAQTRVDYLIDHGEIYQDENGTFYTFSKKEDSSGKVVKGTEVIIPVRPHNILKLICNGGSLDGILEKDDIDNYEGCDEFLNTIKANKNVNTDLYFIRKFLKNHDHIEGNSWKYNEKNVVKTKLVSIDLSQTCMSNVKYVYDVLCNCAVTDTKDKKETYNYSLTIDDNLNVSFKPIEISSSAKPKAHYSYYGLNKENNEHDAQLLSFSADTNFLTAYLTGDKSNIDNMSNLNLVTGEEMNSDFLAKTSDKVGSESGSKESKYKYNYKTTSFKPTVVNTSNSGNVSDWLKYWQDAQANTYKAEANIIGYSGLAPGDYIDIVVVPRPGMYHHTSGLYFIQKITDSVENGVFKSKLTLIKNVASMGSSASKK